MEKEHKQNRPGLTKTTSVSVSNEFMKLMEEHGLSPTECFRRGVAVTLCDCGVERYANPLNEERLRKAKEFLKTFDDDEAILLRVKKIKEALEIIQNA